MINSASKLVKYAEFEGIPSGGRACSGYKRRLRQVALTSKQFKLFNSGKDMPKEDEYDDRIDALSELVNAYSLKLTDLTEVDSKERLLNASHCATLESLRKQKEDVKSRVDAMTEAGDVGIAFLSANGGKVIKELIDRLRSTSTDSMDLLRKVDKYIGVNYGGNAAAVRDEMEQELLAIPAATTKERLLAVFTQMQSLYDEIDLHIEENTTALEEGTIGPSASALEKIRQFRRRVSNIADPVKSMREFIDKKHKRPLTWERVQKHVIWMCQNNVTTVDELGAISGSKEEVKVHALKAAPTLSMEEAMATIASNGGTVSFAANVAVEQQQRPDRDFGGRGGGRGGVFFLFFLLGFLTGR